VTVLSHVSALISPQQQHHLAFISDFNVQMLSLPGLNNVVAHFFSRPPSLEPPGAIATIATVAAANPVDFEAMATEQNHCAETQRLLGGLSLKIVFQQAGAQSLVGGVSTGGI
jgi:hypothetical protein